MRCLIHLKIKAFIRYLIVSLIFIPAFCFAAQSVLTRVQVLPQPDYTRIIFKIAAPNTYHVFMLANPYRLVVDLDHTRMVANLKNLNFTHSILTSARKGWPVPSRLRIVFDMTGAANIKQFVTTDRSESQLVVDVYPRTKMVSTSAPDLNNQKPTEVFAQLGTNDLKNLPKAVTVTSQAEINKEFSIANISKKPKVQLIEVNKPRPLVVVIDAGHGGKDPGTIGINGTREKDVVLAIALRLADLISQDPKLKVSLTRRGDYFVTLKGRLQLARKDKADLFIAIHADSYFNDHSVGASVYALSQHGASSMAARWLADRENHSELGGVDLNGLGDNSYMLRSVLIDLAQTATIIDSVRLGTDMLKSLESVTSLHYARVEQAPFMVLKSPDIPSILVETGFLSNPEEEERLRDPEYRDKLAHALLSGIRQFVATHPMLASNSRPRNEDTINSQV